MSAPPFRDRMYAVLMRAYPRAFRDRYGTSLHAFQRDRMRDARDHGQSRVLVWIAVISDLLASAAAEHIRALRARRTPSANAVSQLRTDHPMHHALQDLTYAVRSLIRRPAFAIVVIATIALGVGVNAAVFSVVNGVLLRPLPYPHAEQVFSFGHEPPYWLTSDPNYIDYQRGIPSIEGLAAYTQALATLSSDGEPDRVRAVRVSPEFFRTLGVSTLVGRAFSDDEFRGNPPTAVVLSHALWMRRFGGDPSVINSHVILNGIQRTVVGVMPRYFNYPEARTDLWIPMPRINADSGDRTNNYLFMVGRAKPGASIDRVRAEANVVAARIMKDFPGAFDPKKPLRPHIEAVSEQLVKSARPYLFALLGIVGFVLLISCANVANLLLARAEGRRREIAVRSALGASGARLVTQMLTESVLVAFAGGALGLGVAWATNHVLVALAPGAIPRLEEVSIDWRVVAFTFGASTVTGLVIGVVPALRAGHGHVFDALRAANKSVMHGAARGTRRVLVVAEVALAVVALAGASMLLRSLWNLEAADTGFVARNVLTARVSVSAREYNEARTAVFYQQLVDRLGAIPGVQAAAAAGWLPVVDANGLWGFSADGRLYGAGSGNAADQPSAAPQHITPGYFKAMGIRVLAGREFTPSDRAHAGYVAIVSEALAKATWPGQDPLGHEFRVGGDTSLPRMTVVGVVGDIKSRGFSDRPDPTMYFPAAQSGRTTFFIPRAMSLIVRTSGNPQAMAGAVRAAVRALDPTIPISEVRTMEEVVGTSVATRRFSTSLLAIFAILALTLAGIGTYGVIAYGVAQRTYEIGVRMALGAERQTVMWLVMLEGIRMCAAGLAVGLLGSVALGRAMRTMLVDVRIVDAPSLLATSALLMVVAVLATALPARRALGVSPTEALRGS